MAENCEEKTADVPFETDFDAESWASRTARETGTPPPIAATRKRTTIMTSKKNVTFLIPHVARDPRLFTVTGSFTG
jgi:hypothetical protein